MCDYWISADVPAPEIVASVRAGLATLDASPSILLLETSGSFLDSWEVPDEARREILAVVRDLGPQVVTFETRADTVTVEAIAECVALVLPSRLCIEIGVESTDDWILRYCINKLMRVSDVRRAVEAVVAGGATAVANVLVGTPFLAPREQVADAARSVRETFAMGFEHCVLFPVNTKNYTVTHWLEERGLYARPPLWALADVLAQLDPAWLQTIDVAWHRSRPDYHPGYASRYRAPETCPACFDRVAGVLDRWRASCERKELVDLLASMRCRCRDRWDEACRAPADDLRGRLTRQYERVARELLGADAWATIGVPFTASIAHHTIEPESP